MRDLYKLAKAEVAKEGSGQTRQLSQRTYRKAPINLQVTAKENAQAAKDGEAEGSDARGGDSAFDHLKGLMDNLTV
jgi:hypothetical protein